MDPNYDANYYGAPYYDGAYYWRLRLELFIPFFLLFFMASNMGPNNDNHCYGIPYFVISISYDARMDN